MVGVDGLGERAVLRDERQQYVVEAGDVLLILPASMISALGTTAASLTGLSHRHYARAAGFFVCSWFVT